MRSLKKRDAALALLGVVLLVCLALEPDYWWLFVTIILVAALLVRARDQREDRQEAS